MYFTNRFHLVKQLNDHNVVKFKDPLVEQLLIQHKPSLKQGNITLYDLSQYKDISGIFQNSDIQYFDEFKYFTSIEYIGGSSSQKDLKNNFINCTKLKVLTFPPNIKKILYGTITRTSLESLIIPSAVTYIQSETFVSNPNLKILIFKSETLSIGSGIYHYLNNNANLKVYCKPLVYEIFYQRFQQANNSGQISKLVKYENENELPKF